MTARYHRTGDFEPPKKGQWFETALGSIQASCDWPSNERNWILCEAPEGEIDGKATGVDSKPSEPSRGPNVRPQGPDAPAWQSGALPGIVVTNLIRERDAAVRRAEAAEEDALKASLANQLPLTRQFLGGDG